MPVKAWDKELSNEEIFILWNHFGERDIDPLYGIDNESK